MKKFCKLFSVYLLVCLCSGCTIDYNLTVTNKKEIIENATVLELNDTIQKYDDSILNFLNSRQTGLQNEGYNADVILGDLKSGLEISNNYKNFDTYANSVYFNSLFEKVNITNNNGLFTFETSGEYYRNNVFLADLSQDFLYNLDEINVNIKFYNVVESHNADKVDEANNIYTWVLKKDDSYRNISFKLQDKVRYDVMFKDLFNKYKVLFVVLIVIIILIIYGIFKLMNIIKKNNKI